MEASFFRNVGQLNIHDGKFVMDNSRKTTTHHHDTTINDRSQRTTNYGGYTNFGQHADGNGRINNYGAQTTNHGAVYGYRQYNGGMNDWTPSSSDEDNFTDYAPLPALSQNPPYRQDRLNPGDRDYSGRYPAATQSDPRLGSKRAKETRLPRANTERQTRSRQDFDHTSPQFRNEYDTMSPQMKRYLQKLGFNHDAQDSLNEEMANVSLDDPAPQTHSSGVYGNQQPPDVAWKGKNVAPPSAYDSDEEGQLDESDQESDFPQYSSSYTHNDNRVITKNINSHNTNTENVVDSYNDNSTRTDIRKQSAR